MSDCKLTKPRRYPVGRISPPESLNSGMAVRGAAVCLLVVAAAGSVLAVDVPDAGYYEELTISGELRLGRSNARPEHLSVSESIDERGSVQGFAETTPGPLPAASMALHLTGHHPHGINCRAIATTSYAWVVEQIGGEPYFAQVPVYITTLGRASCSTAGDVQVGFLYAKAILNFVGSTSFFEADLTNSTGEKSFDRTFRKFVGTGHLNQVGLIAWGHAEAESGGSVDMEAHVDPQIAIDPNFSRAGDFRIVFSPGTGPLIEHGDFDSDSDVDGADLDHLQDCATGPAIPLNDVACRDADLDHDGDTDQEDFAILQRCLSGADVLVDPECAS